MLLPPHVLEDQSVRACRGRHVVRYEDEIASCRLCLTCVVLRVKLVSLPILSPKKNQSLSPIHTPLCSPRCAHVPLFPPISLPSMHSLHFRSSAAPLFESAHTHSPLLPTSYFSMFSPRAHTALCPEYSSRTLSSPCVMPAADHCASVNSNQADGDHCCSDTWDFNVTLKNGSYITYHCEPPCNCTKVEPPNPTSPPQPTLK